jgi:SsrA-binding protein
MKLITQNKKASYDYHVLDTLECGIALYGDEVKALRAGQVRLDGSYALVRGNHLLLLNCHIAPYSHAYQKGTKGEDRNRTLLAHRREIVRLAGDTSRKGITLIPLKLYFNDKGKIKLLLGLCKHKKAHEQKELIKERDIARETRRELAGKW